MDSISKIFSIIKYSVYDHKKKNDSQFIQIIFSFDHYLGIPYSHDMCPCDQCFPRGNVTCHDTCRPDTVACPLYKDDKIIQQPAVLTELDNLYTSQAVKFIEVQSSGTDKPEFVMGCFRKFLIGKVNHKAK